MILKKRKIKQRLNSCNYINYMGLFGEPQVMRSGRFMGRITHKFDRNRYRRDKAEEKLTERDAKTLITIEKRIRRAERMSLHAIHDGNRPLMEHWEQEIIQLDKYATLAIKKQLTDVQRLLFDEQNT